MKGINVILCGQFAFKSGPKARLQKEALILRRLRHPNIITLTTIYKGQLVLPRMRCHLSHDAMKIIKGSQLAIQMLDAVAYLHSQHIIHADIKPGNILVEPGRAILCDFGVSMFLNAVNEFPVQSDPYRSPYKHVGPHLDMWPLGQIILTYCGPKWAAVGTRCQEKDVMAPSKYKPLVLKTEHECERDLGVHTPSHRSLVLGLDINDRPLVHDILYRHFINKNEKCWSPQYIKMYTSVAKTLCGDDAAFWVL